MTEKQEYSQKEIKAIVKGPFLEKLQQVKDMGHFVDWDELVRTALREYILGRQDLRTSLEIMELKREIKLLAKTIREVLQMLYDHLVIKKERGGHEIEETSPEAEKE